MNPIQQAISALEKGGAWSPGVGEAMDILRSLQKEVEGVLPFPKYIYHFNPSTNEEDMFEFANSGAVDEGCVYCERLYTADQLRTAVAAALGRGAVPQGMPIDPVHWCIQWIRDHYQDHPTIDGLCAAMLSAAPSPDADQPTQAEAPSERKAGHG